MKEAWRRATAYFKVIIFNVRHIRETRAIAWTNTSLEDLGGATVCGQAKTFMREAGTLFWSKLP